MIPLRLARELVYQLDHAGEHERLMRALSSIPIFRVLYGGETQYDVLGYWARLGNTHDIEQAYSVGLEAYRAGNPPAEVLTDVLVKLAEMYDRTGRWQAAMVIYRHLSDHAVIHNDRKYIAAAYTGLGWILQQQGSYVEAMEQLEQARTISEELGDRHALSRAVGIMGNVYANRGEWEQALECYEQQKSIATELGNRRGVSIAIGSMGTIYLYQGEFECALEYYKQQKLIDTELDNRGGISVVAGNMGLVYRHQGEYERALECFLQSKSLGVELGNPKGVSIATGNIGEVYTDQGKYQHALECYDSALDGHRRIGFLHGITYWLHGKARALLELATEAGQMPEYLPQHVGGVTAGTWYTMSLQAARENAEECVAISEQLSKPDTLFGGRILLSRIDAAEGRTDATSSRLKQMLHEATDDDQRAELHYWLWHFLLPPLCKGMVGEGSTADAEPSAGPLSISPEDGGEARQEAHRTEALRLYQSLLAATPKHAYKQRIDELTTSNKTGAIT